MTRLQTALVATIVACIAGTIAMAWLSCALSAQWQPACIITGMILIITGVMAAFVMTESL